MTVLILDDRWPTLIPLEAHGRIENPVTFTGEVPISVRWNFDSLISGEDVTGRGTLVTTDPDDPEVLARAGRGEHVIEAQSRRDPVRRSVEVMRRAVSLGEWEAGQTHESLLPYLEEEAAEFAEAVRSGAGDTELRRELGDVYLQILFHAEIASRRGAFDFADVAQSFVDKLRSRAPYLFDGTTLPVGVDEQNRLWAEGKQAEKNAITGR
ncbi:MazG nucleotide pyrophosphohydrolase domain-containing protein [Corynebacterium guangdongense]|uniref:XTP/dITP diphosphohydrolase n=1 Tax=Corynebacterium guangdongense TaxID=1783348 RepID=A0ABU1ZVE9_9CORY|nr:MazG nucleotide pyrophosphohydrolase domain-containing protein [Corynebacterium guangdongense]MDR7328907.1 XTP/dITP diphosphohydrolase [Corynebacterium guangdongense]WJZ17482.1 Nucleoside triphosphate pyrophosphohydrolase [Corynebacterium guangdongense]